MVLVSCADQSLQERRTNVSLLETTDCALALFHSVPSVHGAGGMIRAWREDHARLLWEIYYHFFLSSEALEALIKHVKKLLEISRSMGTWSASIYAKSLRFLSDATLHRIREFWQSYLVFYDNAYSKE